MAQGEETYRLLITYDPEGTVEEGQRVGGAVEGKAFSLPKRSEHQPQEGRSLVGAGGTAVRSPWKVGLVLWIIGLLFSSSVSAYELSGQDWSYMANPMGEDWRVCTTGMPGSGSLRTQDGASEWNYDYFNFTFGSDACLSGGVYPTFNDVNQVDFGGDLGASTLAQTTWYYQTSTGNILECDMRFHNAFK